MRRSDTGAPPARVPSIRITLGGIEDFDTIVGLLRDTGARRDGPRSFIIDSDMTTTQVAALLALMDASKGDGGGDPVDVLIDPPGWESPSLRDDVDVYDWWDDA